MDKQFHNVALVVNQDEERDLPITDKAAEDAFRLLLEWVGEDPSREGLLKTPQRVVKAWKQFFAGYREDPRKHLETTFEEVEDYHDIRLDAKVGLNLC